MAAHALPVVDAPPRNLPLAPDQRPSVIAAARLLDRVEAEHRAAVEAHMAAERAVATAADSSAEATLAAIEAGRAPPGSDPEFDAAVRATAQRLKQTGAARDLAALRHREALAETRADLATELRELVAELVAEAAVAARDACALNDQARQLLTYGAAQAAPGLPPPFAAALKLPTLAQLDHQLAEARRSLAPAAPPPTPPGTVCIRWTAAVPPYLPGETCGLDQDEAVLQIRAGFAELVDPGLARKLGVDKLVRFDQPARIKLTKSFTPRAGATIPAGVISEFDPATASRLVNLGFGVMADE